MKTMKIGDLCLVTGVSGYLASWIAKQLLDQGFRVRGTVRTLGDESRNNALRRLLPGIALVAADLRSPQGWAEAVTGVRWVFHVASPQAVPSERDRTGGAVAGTRHLLQAALASASVEKIVLTSSEAAIAYGHPRAKQHFTEDDWTVLDGPAGKNDYFRSKTLAERLAWDMVSDRSANPGGIPLAVINPSFIAGPSLVPWGRFSLDLVKNVAEGRIPAFPDMVNYAVDVRDCAVMHIAIMDDPAANGHRHFSFGAVGKMVRIAQVIREQYADRGFAPRARVIPTWVLGVARLFSSQVGSLYSKLSQPNVYETKWPDVYRYRYRDFDQIIVDSMDSMLAHGWIKPRHAD
ncbi:NAD-dependent epimerase/dehydratase family protein [Burkholderia multivorans]|uniref:NAD-dependent epimerase/dehydratase family protein n=1 Tax=Burkholderia multivorans TaxID=87883 RepID=UPI0021C112A3|nr:NAD-dependent epimerase/dehydratase family protein [Burkholderia multivorans]